jgi:hypothetical protein
VNGTDASFAQEVCPVFLRAFVVYSVFEVKGEKILDLNRRRKSDGHIWIGAERDSVSTILESLERAHTL